MFRNYISIIIRNIKRSKLFTFINVLGLALGIMSVIVIFLIITFETSFDKHHDGYDSIYRIIRIEDSYGEIKHRAGIPYPFFDAFKVDFPEIENAAIVDMNLAPPVLSVTLADGKIKRFKEEEGVAFVSERYFDIFQYDWIAGNKENRFNKTNAVVISQKVAQKYFGRTDVIGEVINYNNSIELVVTWVVKDVPVTTELPFNFLISFEKFSWKRGSGNWGSTAEPVQLYFKLPLNVSREAVESRLKDFVEKNYPAYNAGFNHLRLQGLTEIHYDDRYYNYNNRSVTMDKILLLGAIGFLIIIMSCINFVNLNTALAFKRSVEVGIRKVLGGTKFQLVVRFLGESALLTFAAFALGILLTEIALPNVDFITRYKLSLSDFDYYPVIFFSSILFFVVTLLAGLYPAFYLSKFNPVKAVKNDLVESYKNGWSFRRILIVFQFAVSQALLIAAVVVIYQIEYVRSVNLGFEKEGIVEVELPSNKEGELDVLKNKLKANSFVENVTFSSTGVSSGNLWWSVAQSFSGKEQLEFETQVKFIDEEFVAAYGLELLAGHNVIAGDSVNNFIVNEEFVKALNLETNFADAIGKEIKIWGLSEPVTGVVKNFNYTSLHEEIRPTILIYSKNNLYMGAIKLKSAELSSAIEKIRNNWSSVYPQYVFEYEFLDNSLQEFYEEEEKLSTMFNVFCFIAVLIGCMGLFGLSSFMAERRSKEIGIRKVLGANLKDIISLVSADFIKLITISSLVGSVAAYLIMNNWLQGFAYRVNLEWWIFAGTAVLTLIVTVLTTSYQAIKAGLSNPVEALKYE
ncbi:MAG: ABC transporter permease [Ignavibacteria bacterium]|jgi:ABC-type antimicrobial peptide transport system permease subunit